MPIAASFTPRRPCTSGPRRACGPLRSRAVALAIAASAVGPLTPIGAAAEDAVLTEELQRACEDTVRHAPLIETIQPPETSPLAPYARFCHALTRETVLGFRDGVRGYVCTLVFDPLPSGYAPKQPDAPPDPDEDVEPSEAAEATGDDDPEDAADAARAAFDTVFGADVRERIEANVSTELIHAFRGFGGMFADVYLLLDRAGRVRVEHDRESLLSQVRVVDTPAEVMRVIGLTAGMAFGGCDAMTLDRTLQGDFVVDGLSYHRGRCAPITRLKLRITTSAQVEVIDRNEDRTGVCLD